MLTEGFTCKRSLPAVFALLLLALALPPAVTQDNQQTFTFLKMTSRGVVTWDRLTDVTYILQICSRSDSDSGFVCPRVFIELTSARLQVPNVNPESQYKITVSGRTSDQEFIRGLTRTFPPWDEEEDGEKEATLRPATMPEPENLTIAETGAITWDAVADADHYLVDWKMNDDDWDRDNKVDGASFTIPEFKVLADYHVEVRAVGGENDEVKGKPATATWLPPDAPANLAILATGKVTWSAVTDADHYLVDWSRDGGTPAEDNKVRTTSFNIPGFDISADYVLEVKAVDSKDRQGPEASVTRTPPDVPVNLAMSITGAVSWDAVTDASHYVIKWIRIELSESNRGRTSTNGFSIPGFDPSADYVMELRAVSSDNTLSAAARAEWTPPDAPDGLRILEAGSVVWDPVPQASRFSVDWREEGGEWNMGNQVNVAAQALDNPGQDQPASQDAREDELISYDIPDFTPSKGYEAKVTSFNENDVPSVPPAEARFEAVQPSKPTNLHISREGTLSWSGATLADWYHVGWQANGGEWSSNTRVDGTSLQISGFDPMIAWVLSVQAVTSIEGTVITGEVVFAYWGTPGSGGPGHGGAPGGVQGSLPLARCIARHDGSTLIVCLRNGWVEALDHDLEISLHNLASCSAEAGLPAQNSALHVNCDAAGNMVVTQLNPQHPQDRRRDILVFDPAVTVCYRAYEYLETGEIEVWYRGCN